MKKLIAVAAVLSLSACVAPIDNTGAVVVPVPVGVPIIITDTDKTDKEKNDSVHVCKIKAFTKTYTAENTNRGKAQLAAKKQCLANNNEMFCRDADIECTEYK